MDEAAFIGYAQKYKDMIYRIALNFFGEPQDAEDMVQEVLMKLYTKGGRLDGDDRVRYWLIRVTINTCKSLARSRGRRQQVPIEGHEAVVPFRREDEYALYSAVMSLPEKYRMVLYLFYYEELTTGEIGELLGIKTSAVTTRLSRAREMLKTELL